MSNKYADYEEWKINDPVAVFLQNFQTTRYTGTTADGRREVLRSFKINVGEDAEKFICKMLLDNTNLTQGNVNTNHITSEYTIRTRDDATNAVTLNALILPQILEYAWLYHKRKEPSAQSRTELKFKINSDGTVDIIDDKNNRVTSYVPDTVNNRSVEQCDNITHNNTKLMCKKALEVVLGLNPNATAAFGNVGTFKDMELKSKLSFAYSICKSLHWPLDNNMRLIKVEEMPDLPADDEFVLALNKLQNAAFTYRANGTSTIGNNDVTNFFKYCVELINTYPEIIELRPTQKFSQPKPRWNMRMRPEWLQNAQVKNIMQSTFGLVGGARILVGGENGVQYGGGINGFADAFAANLDRLVQLLKSQGKALTSNTYQTINRHINTVRELENKLTEFAKDLNKYVNANPNDGLRQVDETNLKTFNTTTKQLTNKIVLVSDGLFKITGHLTQQAPTTKTPGNRKL